MGEARNIRSHSRSPHSSLTAQAAHARASLRPPVFNPYDRFTQPEFDAWIGDITGALKRALNHDAEAEVDVPPRHGSSWNTIPDKVSGGFGADGRAQSPTSSEARDDESVLEDSFAQITSRRAKGKARDPREGPGLGLKGLPIELLSDSEEEEVVNSLEVGAEFSEDSAVSDGEDSSGDTDYTESELDEGGEASSGWPGTSTQHIVALPSSENSGQDQEVGGTSDFEVHHAGYEDLQSPRYTEAYNGDGSADFAVLGDRGTSDDFPVQRKSVVAVDVELVDPWEGPRTFAEDYYSGGDRLAPGLTPNHLTPLEGSPVPAFVPDFPTAPNITTEKNQVSPSAGVLSTSPSPKPYNIVDSDEIDELHEYGTTVATSVNNQEDIGEPAARSYYDPVEVVDITVHAAEVTEVNVVESIEGVRVFKGRLNDEEISTSLPLEFNLGTKGRDPEWTHEIISVSPSDDEHTDADGEEDEGKFLGLLPLGTSDLDIRDDWRGAGMQNDVDDASEEDELQEMVSSQTVDDVAKAAALALSKAVDPSALNAPLLNPRAPILASTFQLTDTDSFGDLPVSSPPSGSPSPALGQPTGAFELQRHSIEQLFAELERESSERPSQAPDSPGSLVRQSDVETANDWTTRELESILSGEISDPGVVEASGFISAERSVSQEDYPGYIVEEVKFETQIHLPDDDFGDTHSIPPPDLTEVVETIQMYDVEEPRTDGRLTEEPEITTEFSRNEGTTVPQLVVSSVESTTTPITSEQYVWPSQRALVDDAIHAELPLAVPAPIVADPSVPDPLPGDSSTRTRSPLITDSPNASGISVIPPASLRVIDLDSPQISSGVSGLFTPAQRSEGGTPDAAEAPTTPHDGTDKGPATASIPLQPDDDSSPIELIAGYKDGGNAEDKDACVDDLIEPSQLVPHNERHVGIETVGIVAQTPAVDAVESADKTSEESSRIPLRGPPEHSGVPGPSGERLLGCPSMAGGDEDADGEADPDYSHHGTKNFNQTIAHRPESEVTFNKSIRDTLRPKVTTLGLESRPTSASVHEQEEPETVEETFSGSLVDTPTLQDRPSVEGGVVQDNGDPATVVQSEVKASTERKHQARALKRKRRDPNSESGVGVKGRKKKGPVLSSSRTTATFEKAQSERVDSNVEADSVDDGASETASVSSSASVVYRLLRARSVVSSASGDASWTSPPTSGLGSVIPLIHSHGLHRHDWPAPPSPASSLGPYKGTRPEQTQAKSPTSSHEPSTPSLRRTPSTNSPVTRSNCRFRKISLPRGEDGGRAYFVVPGCSLGDGELMDDQNIKDEGFSTHEDHKRLFTNVETLDLSPYLVGVLRQLVGVDLLREQQEIFYLPSEDEKPKRRRQKGASERFRQFQRQSISSGGPSARDHSPRLSEVSQSHGTPRSAPGSVVSGSVREGSTVRSDDGDSILSDNDGGAPGETPTTKRPKFSAVEPPLASTFTDGELDHSAAPEHSTLAGEEPTISSKPAPRRSKRKALHHDAAAYKPSEDDIKEGEEVEETKTRRSSVRKPLKRSRTTEENSTNTPRSKKKRLGRSISVAGAGTMDS